MTAEENKLTTSLCLIWEAERPFLNKIRRSRVFYFENNCEWYLELVVGTGGSPGLSSYNLYMVLTKMMLPVRRLMVHTYYLNPQQCPANTALFHQRYLVDAVKSPRSCISTVNISEVENNLHSFSIFGNLKIVCVVDDFIQPAPLSLKTRIKPPGPDQPSNNKSESPLNSSEIQKSSSSVTKDQALSECSSAVIKDQALSECSSSVTKDQIISLENLSKDLEAMLDNKILPDLQLTVEAASIPCHRAVLASRSKVFAAMFQHEMTESTSGVLEIKDTDLSTIEIFLKYLYCGRIPNDLAEEMLVKLYETGEKYGVDVLKKLCTSELMKKISDENCLSYLSLAAAHNHQEFKDAVAAYIIKDDRIMTAQDWFQFSSENLQLANEIYGKYFEIKGKKKRKFN